MRAPDPTLTHEQLFKGREARAKARKQAHAIKARAEKNRKDNTPSLNLAKKCLPNTPAWRLSDKELPDHAWYLINSTAVNERIYNLCSSTEQRLARYPSISHELVRLIKAIRKGKEIPQAEPKIIAMTGGQGKGKSTMINSLLHRWALAVTSDDMKACTEYATKYIWKPGAEDTTDRSDVHIHFLTDDQLTEVINNHLLHSLAYRFKDEFDNDDDFDMDAVRTADHFLRICFDHSNKGARGTKFNALLSPQKKSRPCLQKKKQELISIFLDYAKKLITANAGAERIKRYTDIPDNELGPIRKVADDLFPFINFVSIATGALLLRNGIVLIDLPGIRITCSLKYIFTKAYRIQ